MAIETIERIKEWSIERELHNKKPVKQLWKLVEENGELAEGLVKGKTELIEDAAGDMVVVLTILMQQLDMDIQEVFVEEFGVKNLDVDNDYCQGVILVHMAMLADELIDNDDEVSSGIISEAVINILLAIHQICSNNELYLFECIDVAYNEIKDRKGKTINGSFVKEADL